MTLEQRRDREIKYFGYAIATLAIVLVILVVFLANEYRTLRRKSILSAREAWLIDALKNHNRLIPTDASVVRSWMTFDYVNKLFGLPQTYLQEQLRITDKNYPRITIGKFGTEIHESAASTTALVQNAVQDHITTNLNP